MGEKDIVTRKYLNNPEVFADAFNYFLYGGKKVINPCRLKQIDATEMAVIHSKNKVKGAVQRYRDNLKSLTMMEDDMAAYLILGIEAQGKSHLAMPVRNMVYDGLQYAEQVSKFARTHREAKQYSEAEFLSGMGLEDKLTPVITLVILFDTEPWAGPVNLHEMFSLYDKALLEYVPDYKINLMAPAAMRDEEIHRLSSSLREVILYMKYASDEERLDLLLKQEKRFRTLDMEAARVINVLMNCDLRLDEEKEEVDMCKAIDDMRRHAREEGIAQGMVQGIFASLTNVMKHMDLTVDQAMEVLGIPMEERAEYAAKLKFEH